MKRSEEYLNAAKHYNLQKGQVLHHKDVTLRANDPERYNQWRIEDLQVMTSREHMELHNTLRRGTHRNEDTKNKIAESMKGNTNKRGVKESEQARANKSKAFKGLKKSPEWIKKHREVMIAKGYWKA